MTTSHERSPRRARYIPFLLAHPRFLAFGFTMTLCSGFGQTYFLSTFGDSIRATFDLDKGEWGMFYGIATAASGLAVMTFGRRIDDIDLRRWTTLVVVGLGVSCLFMAATPAAWFLIVSLFCMRFAGQGLMGHTASTSMARYFEAERGRALTLSGLGFALGFAVFPLLGIGIQEVLPWRVAWLVLAGVALLLILPTLRVLLRGHARRHEVWLETERAASHVDLSTLEPAERRRHWTRREVFGDLAVLHAAAGDLGLPRGYDGDDLLPQGARP